MHKRTTQIWGCALALALVGPLAALGSEEDEKPFVPVEKSVTLEATEFKFEPSKLEIPAGREVTLRLENEGVVAHNLIVIQGRKKEARPKIESIQKGDTAELSLRFEDAGTYDFHCDVPGHKQAGMRGVIRVVPAADFSGE